MNKGFRVIPQPLQTNARIVHWNRAREKFAVSDIAYHSPSHSTLCNFHSWERQVEQYTNYDISFRNRTEECSVPASHWRMLIQLRTSRIICVIFLLVGYLMMLSVEAILVPNSLSTTTWRRMESGCIDPRILHLGISWKSVVNFTPRPLYLTGYKELILVAHRDPTEKVSASLYLFFLTLSLLRFYKLICWLYIWHEEAYPMISPH
jgi:hypothetical protein